MLNAFAAHIRLTPQECLDANKVAQRFLALHLSEPELAYPFVGDDLAPIKLRTHGPSVDHYGRHMMDVPLFVSLLKDSKLEGLDLKNIPIYARYVNTVFPLQEGEERWQVAKRPNKWREHALFLALNYAEDPGLSQLVAGVLGHPLVPKGAAADETHALCGKLKAFASSMPPLTRPALYQEMGKVIAALVNLVPDLLVETDIVPPEAGRENFLPNQQDEVQKPQGGKWTIKIIAASVVPPKAGVGVEGLEKFSELLDEHRKGLKLPPTFSRVKLAKQLMVSPFTSVIPPEICGRYQDPTRVPILTEAERSQCAEMVDCFQQMDTLADASSSPHIQSLASVTRRAEWEAPSLLKALIAPHSSRLLEGGRVLERYQKSIHDGMMDDVVLVQAILALK